MVNKGSLTWFERVKRMSFKNQGWALQKLFGMAANL